MPCPVCSHSLLQSPPPPQPPPFPAPLEGHPADAYPLAWAPLAAGPFRFLCEDRGKKCVFGALAAGTAGASSLLERGAELGEPGTSGEQEPGDPVPGLPPTHTHCWALSRGLRFPTCQTSGQPRGPSNLSVVGFSASDSGPEQSSRATTGGVEVLEEEEGNQGGLPGGRGLRTPTHRLDHPAAQRPLPLSAEP